MELHTGIIPTKRAKLRARFIGAHEQQHVTDFAGTGRYRREMREATNRAMAAVPRTTGRWQDIRSGRSLERLGEFGARRQRYVGVGEGAADRAAELRTKAPANAVTGYPIMAGQQQHFGHGYERGGGTPASSNILEALRERSAGKRKLKDIARGG